MLRKLKEEMFYKILCIQFIKKLKIKSNAHIPINYFYICIINLCLNHLMTQVNISQIIFIMRELLHQSSSTLRFGSNDPFY